MGCCNNFEQNSVEVTREGNAIFKGLDHCGDKANYLAVEGQNYEKGQMVKLSDTIGAVETTEGADAIGISLSSVTAAENGEQILVQRTGHVLWKDIAEANKLDVNSKGDFWKVHKALITANIYVEA